MAAADSELEASSGPTVRDRVIVRWFVRLAIVVAIIAVAAQLAEIPWRSALRGYDNTFNHLWLRSLMVDGDWHFANDVEACDTLAEEDRVYVRALPPTETGHMPNKYGVGWAVLTAPAYLLADAVVRIGGAVGVWSLTADGFNAVYQATIHLWHVALAVVALVLTRRALARYLDEPWATAGVVTVWLGSPLVYYQTSNAGMSHNAVFFGVAVALFGLVEGLDRRARGSTSAGAGALPWLLAGAGLGLAAITRYQAAVFGLLALAALLVVFRRHGLGDAAADAGFVVLGAVPFIAIQLLAWRVVYGRWLVFSYGEEGEAFNWMHPELGNVLFSSWHGLFYWHPLLLLALIGLIGWTVSAARRAQPSLQADLATGQRAFPGLLTAALLGCALATIYINASWWCWWFAAAFGSRAFDGALVGLMAGQAFLLARAGPRTRRILLVAGGMLAVWNIYAFVLYRTAAISRADPVTWFEMLAAAPRLLQQLAFE